LHYVWVVVERRFTSKEGIKEDKFVLPLEEETNHAKKISKLKENWGLKTHDGHLLNKRVGRYLYKE
jgi:hypothetical protein